MISADRTLAHAVAETLNALELGEPDTAAKELAKHYAFVVDNSSGHCRGCEDLECKRGLTSAWLLRWIGPLLLDTLTALGATPAARAALKKGQPERPSAGGGLAALRNARGA